MKETKIEVLNNKGDLVTAFKKKEFDMFSREKRVKLGSEIQNEKHKVICRCTEEPVFLKVSKKPRREGKDYELDYYIKNEEREKVKHNKDCVMHASYTGSLMYRNTWKQSEEDGSMEVLLDESLFGIKNTKEKNKTENKVIESTKNYLIREDGQCKATLRGLIERFNVESWLSFIQSDKEKTLQMFLNYSWRYSHQIKIRTSSRGHFKTLNSYFPEREKKEVEFIYLPLRHIKAISETLFQISVNQVNLGWDKKISCSKDLLKNALESCLSIKIDEDKQPLLTSMDNLINTKVDEHEYRGFLVGGFTRINKKGYTEFTSLEIIQISKQGLWSESSYEAKVYSKLVDEKRIFTKGIEREEEYNNWIPDIIFLDTEHKWYGEIFGIDGDTNYEERKEEKISFAEASDEACLWYWENCRTDNIPEFPK